MSQINAPLSFPSSRITGLADADLAITGAQFSGILVSANTNTNTLTMPDPLTLAVGSSATFTNLDNANALTIATPGAETIDGAASLTIAANTAATLIAAGPNFVTG